MSVIRENTEIKYIATMTKIFAGITFLAMLFVTVSFSAQAQEFSGRGIDMRALQGQAAQCRGPALRLQQRSYVLRQSIADILECNASGGFFQSNGDCVPAVSPPHQFDERHGNKNNPAHDPERRSRLGFEESDGFNVFGIIGGLDGSDIVCQPEEEPDVCEEDRQTQELDCPPGEFGMIEEERFFECPEEEWTEWTEFNNTCSPVCEERTEDRPISCPPGQEGEIVEERDFICPEGEYTPWEEIINTCEPIDECVPDTEERRPPCPEGEVGTIIEERDFLCPEEEWTEWEEVFNNCAAECVEDTRSGTEDCPAGQVGFIQTAEEFVCPEAEWRDLPDQEFCCTPQTETRGSCPEGQIGTFTEERNFVCNPATGTGDWTGWEVVTDTCQEVNLCIGGAGGGTAEICTTAQDCHNIGGPGGGQYECVNGCCVLSFDGSGDGCGFDTQTLSVDDPSECDETGPPPNSCNSGSVGTWRRFDPPGSCVIKRCTCNPL